MEHENQEVLTSEILDTCVQRINDLKGEMATNYYTLGVLLREVEEKCLWAIRKKKDGQGKYKDFSAWARSEVKLGRTQAMKCISVAENFTEEDVRKIGHTKLAIALQVPQAHRKELLEAAENGASKRELEQVAAELTGKPPSDKITVSMEMAEVVLPMYLQSAEYADELGDDDRAVTVDPDTSAVAFETLANGVVQSYLVQYGPDGLELVIKRHRPEQA